MARFSRALTGVCLITLFLLVSSQDADAAKKAKKVKADDTITNKVRREEEVFFFFFFCRLWSRSLQFRMLFFSGPRLMSFRSSLFFFFPRARRKR